MSVAPVRDDISLGNFEHKRMSNISNIKLGKGLAKKKIQIKSRETSPKKEDSASFHNKTAKNNLKSVRKAYSRNRMKNMGTSNNAINYQNKTIIRTEDSDRSNGRNFNKFNYERPVKLNNTLVNRMRSNKTTFSNERTMFSHQRNPQNTYIDFNRQGRLMSPNRTLMTKERDEFSPQGILSPHNHQK